MEKTQYDPSMSSPLNISPVLYYVLNQLESTFPLTEEELRNEWMEALASLIGCGLNPEPDPDDPRRWIITLPEEYTRY